MAERNITTNTYAAYPNSNATVDVPVISLNSSVSECEYPSTPTTIGFLTRDPIGYHEGSLLYNAYFAFWGVDPDGLTALNCWGFSGSPPGLPGMSGLFSNQSKKGQLGFVGFDFTMSTTFSGQYCNKDCGCGKSVTDTELKAEITAKGEFFASTYGGSFSNEFIELTYWVGLKASGGLFGSGSFSVYTDECNCPGSLLGGGCIEIGGTAAIAGGGEANVNVKLPWWAKKFISMPLTSARASLYIEGRASISFRRCFECGCNQPCRVKDRICSKQSISANASVFADYKGKVYTLGASWIIASGEQCTDLN